MTNSTHAEFGGDVLLDFAAVYALDAVSDAERREIDARVAAASPEVAAEFEREVREIREAMAQVSRVGAVEPPDRVRQSLLETIGTAGTSDSDTATPAPISLAQHRNRRRNFLLAAAAAVVVVVGGIGIGSQIRHEVAPPTSTQVFAADDVRTTSGAIEGGGTATVVYSKEVDAGVLVMNNVTPPSEGTVYQMWLIGPEGATSAGTMTPADVAPSTTAVLDDISGATALGFSVEPTGGSTQPSSIFAELPLS
ncbi:anti-sigma factor [Rhodococcus zopfii]|uniref:Regulator of SigK n=1 Tax=Rhodococcus zopfii TaxID=43772 RepID=A0ABU3WUR5_9NOCA|nr:anti-sigma factor [Rhodococcus zopfii]